MRLRGDTSFPTKLGVVTLIAFTVFVSAVRPLTRPSGRLNLPFGLTRMSLLTESPDDGRASLPTPPAATRVIEPMLVVGVLLHALKTRRRAFRSIPIRRLKLPARTTERSLPSD